MNALLDPHRNCMSFNIDQSILKCLQSYYLDKQLTSNLIQNKPVQQTSYRRMHRVSTCIYCHYDDTGYWL